jgi:1-acyl-sn-glycerol-3-phosphate acyltransferase
LKFIRTLFSKLYTLWVLLVFTVFMIIYLPGILLPFLFGLRGGSVSFFFLKVWSWTFSKLNFIPYKVKVKNNIDTGKSYIYVCNHTSYLDIPGICLAIPTQYRPLAKKELKRIPVFGWIAALACVIVDRSSNESRRKSMDHLKDILKRGVSILIFPEGTQNRTDEPLQPFYDGAFRIAIETQQPILPIVTINAGNLMPPNSVNVNPGTITVVVGNEIPTGALKLTDVKSLSARTFEVMKEMITRCKENKSFQN